MKKYVVYDEIDNGDSFDEVFDTEERALNRAFAEWDHLSDHDKKRRSSYIVAECELDEDGCVEWNTAKLIKRYK